jgi:hypothetical protein
MLDKNKKIKTANLVQRKFSNVRIGYGLVHDAPLNSWELGEGGGLEELEAGVGGGHKCNYNSFSPDSPSNVK